jgi:CubicO group peptidase (beta-lactamase class C family)
MLKIKWTYRLALIVAIPAIIIGCAGSFRPLTPDMIRTDLEGVRKQYAVPSLGVAEVTADDIITYGPVGKGGIKRDRPLTPDSYYQLASCTKAMTATALAKLMQQDHAISWDTRLLDLFPEFAATANPAYRDVTLGDIASHQAGFRNEGRWNHLREYGGSLTQYVGEILQQKPNNKRGSFHYSNNNYTILGAVIEHRTGLTYPEAMNKLLFEPLGVKAHFGYPRDLGPDQPWGHATTIIGTTVPVRPKSQVIPNVLGPAGSISLTLHDFARFLQLHLRGLLGHDDTGYTADMINQLHLMRIMNVPRLGASAYAAGWYIYTFNHETIHEHGGSNPGFVAEMLINPVRKKGFVFVSNIDQTGGEPVGMAIFKALVSDGPAVQ